jgi:RNA polymerase sigma-70 factor (ECF subfamily)
MITYEPGGAQTDEQLVLAIREDSSVFVYIMARYEASLLRFVHRISNVSKEEAEDILQDAFISMYKHIHAFDPKRKFSSWAYRIVRHEVIDHFRRRKSRPQVTFSELGDDVVRRFSDSIDIPALIDRGIAKEKVLHILDQLDYKYKEVLVLQFLEGKSYEEISDILKKPIGTIGTQLNRAKKQFAKIAHKEGVVLE